MKSLFLALALTSALVDPVLAVTPSILPDVHGAPAENLVGAKERLEKKDPSLAPALQRLIRDADRALAERPASVMDKTKVPFSGDKHDYYSLAPYWWPDPAKPDGLPYVRRDGEINPESKKGTDSVAFAHTCETVFTLGLAYFFSRDERYAAKAAVLTRTWFLDPATRMNPHLNFGQAVPGQALGRAEGVLEARHLASLTDGIALLAGSHAWTPDDSAALTSWLEHYYTWLTTSKIALGEREAKNNHGTWYDAQTAHLALALGKSDEAKALLGTALGKRVDHQVEPDGRQPLELARTKSLEYSLFNLEALFHLAALGEHVGVSFWNHVSPDGRSLRGALYYVSGYIDPARVWPKKDVVQADRTRILPLIAQALRYEDQPELRQLFSRFSSAETNMEAWHLLWLHPDHK